MATKKYVTFFHFLGIPYADNLAVPEGREFQKVLIQDHNIEIFRGGDLSTVTKSLPLCSQSFDKIFDESAIVIIHDCMFSRESFLADTDDFFDKGGMNALVKYFENGGAVLVQCVEGNFAIGSLLSERFGCKWNLHDIESEYVVASDRGRHLLGEDAVPREPTLCSGKIHFMRCPKGEGLVEKRIYTKEEFIESWGPDFGEEEESYQRYKKNHCGQFAVCVYEGIGLEGKVIWNGDRGQNPGLQKTFEKLLTL